MSPSTVSTRRGPSRGVSPRAELTSRAGFTLVELMVTIAIITLLAGMVLGAMFVAQAAAERSRTESMIRRIEPAVMARYESYRTRRLPIDPRVVAMARRIGDPNFGDSATDAYNRIYFGKNPDNSVFNARAFIEETRLRVLRELMRLELPQRHEDVTQLTTPPPPDDIEGGPRTDLLDPLTEYFGPNAALAPTYASMALAGFPRPYLPLPPLCETYRRRMGNTTSQKNEAAECLYLIITQCQLEAETTGLDVFRQLDVGDQDHDGAPEFHDAWGRPIAWLRWPAGFHNFEPQAGVIPDNPFAGYTPSMMPSMQRVEVSAYQPDPRRINYSDGRAFFLANCDPLDVLKIDYPSSPINPPPARGYVLRPLIYSAGPDGEFDIVAFTELSTDPALNSNLKKARALNDPYYVNPLTSRMIGSPYDQSLGDDNTLGTSDDKPTTELGLNFFDNIHNHQRAERARN